MRAVPSGHMKKGVFQEMVGKGSELDFENLKMKSVSYNSVVCGVFYYVDSEKALINADDCYECELRVEQHRLVVEMHHGHFWKNKIKKSYYMGAGRSDCVMHFMHLFIESLF